MESEPNSSSQSLSLSGGVSSRGTTGAAAAAVASAGTAVWGVSLRLRLALSTVQVATSVVLFSSSTLQPKMVAHVALVEVDVCVVPSDTTETNDVVVEQMDALLVSHGLLSLFGSKVGTRSDPMLSVGWLAPIPSGRRKKKRSNQVARLVLRT